MQLAALWHFPRPALAARYLALLDTGLVTSTTIFAPRRTGKTWFLRRDLQPAAEIAGYRVVYADLWQTKEAPGASLVNALQAALEPRSLREKLKERLQTPVKGLRAKAELAGAKLEGEVQLEPKGKRASSDVALLLAELVSELVKKQPLLLLVDEAQTLARNAAGEDIARALRTAMTLHSNRLRVVFTGSSRSKLAHVFSNVGAPLYSAGVGIQDFPLLDREFVEFIVAKFRAATRRELDVSAAWAAFGAFDFRPEPLVEAVVAITMDPEKTFSEAVALVAEQQARLENHEGTWQALDSLEQNVVRLIADNLTLKPFAKSTLEALRKAVGVAEIGTSHVQLALNRLAEANVVNKTPRGVFEFESESFAEWIRNLAD